MFLYPFQNIVLYLNAIRFVEHFVPAALVIDFGYVGHAVFAVPIGKGADRFRIAADRIVRSRKKQYGKLLGNALYVFFAVNAA